MAESASNQHNSYQTNTSIYIPLWLTNNIFINILEENVENFKQINNFEVKPAVTIGENFMTSLLIVNIEVEKTDAKTQPVSYVIKMLPNIVRMEEMLKDWKVFDKENMIYTSYIPEFEAMYKNAGLRVNFGAKVFATKDSKAPKELIIMENLKVKGFQNVKRQEGLDVEHTQKALEKLAQFHAASACHFELKGNYPDIFKKCLCSEQDEFANCRDNTVRNLKECLPLYNAEYLTDKLITYNSTAPDQFQIESNVDINEFNVLNHGDCWSNNIMFKYNEAGLITETFFVDFQMGRYGSPAHDLNYLLISSTKLENKIKKFDYYVFYYHEKLLENLKLLKYAKKFPTLKDIHIALLKHGDWAYTIITTVMPVILLDPTEKANLDSIMGEGQKTDELKKLMFTNSRYIAHMKQLLPWIDNRGLFVYTKS